MLSSSNFSLISSETTKMREFNQESPVECYILRLIDVLVVLVFMLCLGFNSMLLLAFCRKKSPTKTALDIYMASLTFLNLIGSILEFPFIIISNFYCR